MKTPPQKQDTTAHRKLSDSRFIRPLENLSPSYFGIVMATGIVSLAAHLMAMPQIAHALFVLNTALYLILWLLTIFRIACYPRLFIADLTDHLRGPGFFTIVAATSILGGQFLLLETGSGIGALFLAAAIGLWMGLSYTIFAGLTIKEHKPPLDKGISGSWLLAVVATQSIVVLSALLASHVDPVWRIEMNFFALSMWLWGGMLYIWLISIIFYRYMFLRLAPDDLTPPYWINMGAMAISAFAGSLLALNSPDAPFLTSLAPFIKGVTVLYWATASWWIPMLLVLTIWRYVFKRFPMTYDPSYWAMVFPLGMYAVGTQLMIKALHLSFISVIPQVFLYIALVVWAITFTAFISDLIRRLNASPHTKNT